jgi:hypothetical protein
MEHNDAEDAQNLLEIRRNIIVKCMPGQSTHHYQLGTCTFCGHTVGREKERKEEADYLEFPSFDFPIESEESTKKNKKRGRYDLLLEKLEEVNQNLDRIANNCGGDGSTSETLRELHQDNTNNRLDQLWEFIEDGEGKLTEYEIARHDFAMWCRYKNEISQYNSMVAKAVKKNKSIDND